MESAAAVPETRGTASRAVLDSPDLMARCLEYVPDYFPEFAAVSRTFRTNAAQKLQRALTFVREKGERALGSIEVSESAREAFEEWDQGDSCCTMGGEFAFENWTVRRELPKDVLALFRFAWRVAPGETMSVVGRWGKVARLRWCILLEYYSWGKDRHGLRDYERIVASFEYAYRYMAARVGPDDLGTFGNGLVEMYENYRYECAVNDEEGTEPHVLELWSDSRLKVSFVFGVLADVRRYHMGPREPHTRAITKEHADAICHSYEQPYISYEKMKTMTEEQKNRIKAKGKKDAEAFRQAYDEMISTILVDYPYVHDLSGWFPNKASHTGAANTGPGEAHWFPEYGLEYGRRVAVAQVWGPAPP